MMGFQNRIAIQTVPEQASQEFLHHSSGQRVNTDVVIADALRQQYPELKLTVTPQFSCDLLGFVSTCLST
jgi:transitional endoplasmic reticulum ATPase